MTWKEAAQEMLEPRARVELATCRLLQKLYVVESFSSFLRLASWFYMVFGACCSLSVLRSPTLPRGASLDCSPTLSFERKGCTDCQAALFIPPQDQVAQHDPGAFEQ